MEEVIPCTVCGGSDLNLVDGYYYCTECGTQDMTARETVVERVVLLDGTYARGTMKKLSKKKNLIQMSGEWCKWHAFNFVLCGLADEIIALGAKPSFKTKLLWVWTRYMKKFNDKKDYEKTRTNARPTNNKSIFEDVETPDHETNEPDTDMEPPPPKKKRQIQFDTQVFSRKTDIRIFTNRVLYSIIYTALLLDKSDIQMSQLLRFIREGRLSFYDCIKYIPSDLKAKRIPQWVNFIKSKSAPFGFLNIAATSMNLFKTLDLGLPAIPDLRQILNGFVKELCLPKEFLDLVLSLMEYLPPDFSVDKRVFNHRIPEFEVVVMSYLLIALKMCFGLDDDYEIRLSEAVDRINSEENRLKMYRVGEKVEPTDRLFSFREWICYLRFRNIILGQYYQPIAAQHNIESDNQLIVELIKDRMAVDDKTVTDELTHELLTRIPEGDTFKVMPKEDFPNSFTPLTSYTAHIISKVKDPELIICLSEDFSKYSLKYACSNLQLLTKEDDVDSNIIKGVSESNKIIKADITGLLCPKSEVCDSKIIYIKDMDNKDWIKDYQNTVKNDLNKEENVMDSDTETLRLMSNLGFSIDDSHVSDDETLEEKHSLVKENSFNGETETTNLDHIAKDVNVEFIEKPKIEKLEELEEGHNIFDDIFDVEYKDEMDVPSSDMGNHFNVHENIELQLENTFANYEPTDIHASNSRSFATDSFDPETFDRDEAIKRLVLAECRNRKIPIPPEYKDKQPKRHMAKKDKINNNNTDDDKLADNVATKRKYKSHANKRNGIIEQYYKNFVHNIVNKTIDQTNRIELPDSNECRINNDADLGINNVSLGNEVQFDSFRGSSIEQEQLIEDNHVNDIETQNEYPKSRDQIEPLYADFGIDDPEINELLLKGLEKKKRSPIRRKRKIAHIKEFQDRNQLEPLCENPINIKDFKYYMRRYKESTLYSHNIQYRFDTEIKANCPKSLYFIMEMCAFILEVPMFNFYKIFNKLEGRLLLETDLSQ